MYLLYFCRSLALVPGYTGRQLGTIMIYSSPEHCLQTAVTGLSSPKLPYCCNNTLPDATALHGCCNHTTLQKVNPNPILWELYILQNTTVLQHTQQCVQYLQWEKNLKKLRKGPCPNDCISDHITTTSVQDRLYNFSQKFLLLTQ